MKAGTNLFRKLWNEKMQENHIPEELLKKILLKIEMKQNERIPFKLRGIVISELLIARALEILNAEKTKTLPQNARHNNLEETPDGLDKRLKIKMGNDTCRGHIVSDILSDVGIVRLLKIRNVKTGKLVNATQLNSDYSW
jgi:hypothetical protein